MGNMLSPTPRITSAEIDDETIVSADIKALSIEAADIKNSTITGSKIANTTLSYAHMTVGLLTKSPDYIIYPFGGYFRAYKGSDGSQLAISTDASTVINTVLAQINTDGEGSLYLKRGTYALATTLTVYSKTIIEGEGENTILALNNNINDNVLRNADYSGGNTDITIKNLRINGNYANQSAGHGIFMKKVSRVIFEGLHINGTWDNGIHLEDGINDVLISGCLINQANLGINIYAAAVVCARITIVETIVKASRTYQGIHLKGTSSFAISDVIVSNCMSYENVQDDGILFEYVNRGIIKNCIFRDNGTFNGIDLVGLTDIIVIGNVCYGNADCGIIVGDSAIAGTDRCTIIGNICRNNTSYGILLNTDTDSDENVVANNICTGNNEGIVIGATCDENIIMGNILLGNTTNNLVNSGANNIVDHNNT